MTVRYQLLKNSVPVAVVDEKDLDKYYLEYNADEARRVEDDTDLSVDDESEFHHEEIEKPPARIQGMIYVLVVSDYGESCDGHVRKLGQYTDRNLAEAMLEDDIKYQLEQDSNLQRVKCNEVTNDYAYGSIYDIIEVEY